MDRRKYKFDWKLFVTILFSLIAMAISVERRITTIEVKLDQLDENLKIIPLINNQLFELKNKSDVRSIEGGCLDCG